MAALIAGERDPRALADLARGRLRTKTDRLIEALTGRFSSHCRDWSVRGGAERLRVGT